MKDSAEDLATRGIFVVPQVFSLEECKELIARAEDIGFESASVRTRHGPKMLTDVRNNTRVNLSDARLAKLMWNRIEDHLPTLDSFLAIGVDSRLRFYRYTPGQEFKRHRDGIEVNEDGFRSKLSYLIYLNAGFDGGATVFHTSRTSDELEAIPVKPAAGSALLFGHRTWHAGAAVLSGTKYVLRSDVFYNEPANN